LNPSLDVSQYAHTTWSIRSGELNGSPTSFAQTADGYLWLGTEFGVLRFDGVRFVPWRPPASAHVSDTFVVKLLAGRDINQPLHPSPAPVNLRPVPQFDDIDILESRGNSVYNSLQARVQQRYHGGLTLMASYTWSKSIDDASGFFSSAGDPNFPQDSYNVRAERARSNFDLQHRFTANYSYDLPLAKGHRLLGGWQTYGVLAFQTGRPFTVALRSDLDNSNTGRTNLGFGANDRPNLVGNPKLSERTPDRWFNTSAFAVPPFGSFGNAGRNILDGPGSATVDVSLLKNTNVGERMTVQFRAEAFNLFDRANFDLPDIFVGSPTFGKIQSAQGPRVVQLGLKLVF